MKPVEIIPPSNLEWCDMTLKYEVDSSYEPELYQIKQDAKVAISGNKVYVILYEESNYSTIDFFCINGKIEGDKIVFQDNQIVGVPLQWKSSEFPGMIFCPTYANFRCIDGEFVKREGTEDRYDFKIIPMNLPLSFDYDPDTKFIGAADLSFMLDEISDYYSNSNYIHPYFIARYTSVEKISEDKEDNKPYYNLFGVKYSTRPAIPGIYIHNGIKILIK